MPSLYRTETRRWLDYFNVKDTRHIGTTVEFWRMVERLQVFYTYPPQYFIHDGLLFILTHDARYCFQLSEYGAQCVISGMIHDSCPK